MNRIAIGKELVAISKLIASAEVMAAEPEFPADSDAVGKLAAKMTSKLSPAVRSRTLKQYGIDLKSSDKVDALFKAVAMVYTAG